MRQNMIIRCTSLLTSLLCCLVMSAAFTAGQKESVFDIEIDDLPLPLALKTLAEQTNLQVMFPTDALDQNHRVSISGEYTLKQALNILLVDTRLEYRFDKDKNLAIRPVRDPVSESGEIIPAEYSQPASPQTDLSRNDLPQNKKLVLDKKLMLAQADTPTASQTSGAALQTQSTTLLEEVVVTAQKREQSINEIGISINAFSGEEIRQNRIERMSDLGAYIPNVKMADARPGGNPKVVVRGVGVNDFLVSSNPSTAVYFDGVYSPSIGTISGQFFDLERIEVLKGPQTTMYGRNSTAGTIHAIGRKPTQENNGYLTAGYGNFDTIDAEGAIGGSIGDNVAARISAKTQQRMDGHMNNQFPGGEDIGEIDRTDVRAQLLFSPSEDIEILTTFTYGHEDSVPGAWSVSGRRITPGFGFRPFCAADRAGEHDPANCSALFGHQENDGDPYTLSENNSWAVDSDEFTGNVSITWETDNFTAKSITGYLDWEQRRIQSDGIPQTEVVADRNQEIWQFSQEIQLISPGGQFLDWVIGAYFSTGNTELFRPNETPIFGGDTVNTMDNDITTAQAFAQLDWNLTEQWQLITGLRYTWEDNENTGGTWADTNSSRDIDAGDRRRAFVDDGFTENDVSWKVGLNFQASDDLLLYAGVTRGFKSGGFFAGFAGRDEQLQAYDNETIIAYEGGFKATMADGTFQLNASAFYYDYEDIQTNTNEIVGAAFIVKFDNISEAEVVGAEIDAHWQPAEGLDLRLGIGILDTEVGDFTFGGAGRFVPKGNELPNAPELSISALARYEWALNSDYRLALSGSVSSFDETFQEVENVLRNKINTSATLVNARLQLAPVHGRWDLALWSRNLTDEEYVVSSFQNPSNIQSIYNLPRTYGASFTYYWE